MVDLLDMLAHMGSVFILYIGDLCTLDKVRMDKVRALGAARRLDGGGEGPHYSFWVVLG